MDDATEETPHSDAAAARRRRTALILGVTLLAAGLAALIAGWRFGTGWYVSGLVLFAIGVFLMVRALVGRARWWAWLAPLAVLAVGVAVPWAVTAAAYATKTADGATWVDDTSDFAAAPQGDSLVLLDPRAAALLDPRARQVWVAGFYAYDAPSWIMPLSRGWSAIGPQYDPKEGSGSPTIVAVAERQRIIAASDDGFVVATCPGRGPCPIVGRSWSDADSEEGAAQWTLTDREVVDIGALLDGVDVLRGTTMRFSAPPAWFATRGTDGSTEVRSVATGEGVRTVPEQAVVLASSSHVVIASTQGSQCRLQVVLPAELPESEIACERLPGDTAFVTGDAWVLSGDEVVTVFDAKTGGIREVAADDFAVSDLDAPADAIGFGAGSELRLEGGRVVVGDALTGDARWETGVADGATISARDELVTVVEPAAPFPLHEIFAPHDGDAAYIRVFDAVTGEMVDSLRYAAPERKVVRTAGEHVVLRVADGQGDERIVLLGSR